MIEMQRKAVSNQEFPYTEEELMQVVREQCPDLRDVTMEEVVDGMLGMLSCQSDESAAVMLSCILKSIETGKFKHKAWTKVVRMCAEIDCPITMN